MKIVIAKWQGEFSGEQYTMFTSDSDRKMDCFSAIDVMGDPSHTKYKVFDIDDVFCDNGIECQGQIAEIYESFDHIKERTF